MPLLVGEKAIVYEKKLADQIQQKAFGEREEGKLILDLKEALFLLEKGKIELEDKDGKKVKEKALLKIGEKKEKDFYRKYIVFRDFRDRGYVIKTGYKFGADFRVYPRGKKPGEEHTQWIIVVLGQNEKMTLINFSRMVRLSGNLKTTLSFAVVDSENDINYYEVKRLTP